MPRISSVAGMLAASWLVAASAYADSVPSSDLSPTGYAGPHRDFVHAAVSMDEALELQAGYGRTWRLPRIRRSIDLVIRAGAPMTLIPTFGNWQIHSSTGFVLASARRWGVFQRASLALHHASNPAFEGTGIVLGYGVSGGYVAPQVMLTAGARIQGTATTRVVHSARARTLNPDLRDGWYRGTAGYYEFDVTAGWTLGDAVQLTLTVGLQTTTSFRLPVPPYDFIVPGFATIGVRTFLP